MSKTRYQALGPLLSGEGSRAFLGLALQEGSSAQPVVMVWVPPETAQDMEQVTQIHKETLRAITLEHPNIIRVHALASLEEGLARVVEFADGESLRRVLEVCQKLPLGFAALLVADAATGLHYAHLAGNDDGTALVHGDLRPETLMVCFSGFTKVGGYGALTVAPREPGGKRVVHRRLYAAPEQIIGGRNAISVPTDVYLLGLVLFECLTGHMPFQGEANFDRAIVEKPLPLETEPSIPEALVPLLRKATAKKASERYPSVLAFREALVQAVGPLPTHEELAAYLLQHFPLEDSARAARRRVLEAGLAEDVRKTGEVRALALPPLAAAPESPSRAAAPAPTPAPAASAPAPAAKASAPVPVKAPRAAGATAKAPARPAAAPRRPRDDEEDSLPPRSPSRPYLPVAVAAVLGAAAAIAWVRSTSSPRPTPPPSQPATVAAPPMTPPPVVPTTAPATAPHEALPGDPRGTQVADAKPVEPKAAEGKSVTAEPASATARAPEARPAAFHKNEPGELDLSVSPGVDVSVDGHPAGRSPLKLTLPPGRHMLGFRDRQLGVNTSRSYVIASAGKQTAHISLGKGFLSVAIPSGSVIYLDGHEVSRSSITDFPIYEGGHQLVVTLGQAKWRQGFDVRPDEHMSYNVQAEQQSSLLQ